MVGQSGGTKDTRREGTSILHFNYSLSSHLTTVSVLHQDACCQQDNSIVQQCTSKPGKVGRGGGKGWGGVGKGVGRGGGKGWGGEGERGGEGRGRGGEGRGKGVDGKGKGWGRGREKGSYQDIKWIT